jgi:hypothetical protein
VVAGDVMRVTAIQGTKPALLITNDLEIIIDVPQFFAMHDPVPNRLLSQQIKSIHFAPTPTLVSERMMNALKSN